MTRQLAAQIASYAFTGLVALAIAVSVLGLDVAGLEVPLHYGDDALFFCADVKNLRAHGFSLENPDLGAPGVQRMYAFPRGDSLHSWFLWFVGLASSGFGSTINLYYLLTFPLVALSALWTFRRLDCSMALAVGGALLYTFLYTHLARGITHLPYSGYFLVPPSLLILLWVASDDPRPSRRVLIASAVLCVLLALAHIYYSVFFCFLLFVGGVTASLRRRRASNALLAGCLIATTGATLSISLLPNAAGMREFTSSPQIATRHPFEADTFGLKLAQLVLPVTQHRLAPLRDLKARYNENVRAIDMLNESDSATLGAVATLGLAISLTWLVGRLPWRALAASETRQRTLASLATFNLSAVLLGTVGGLGSLIALLLSPQIRAYNRISVYIGLFALSTVVLIADELYRRRAETAAATAGWTVAIGAVTVLGLLDQIPGGRFGDPVMQQARTATFEADRKLVAELEASLEARPSGARPMVFQLPYHPFPEATTPHRMRDYDHLRGYLHSKRLRFSYGAVRGQPEDLWQWYVTSRSTSEMVDYLTRAGFAALWLDRYGYPGDGQAVEAELRQRLGEPIARDGDGRRLVFALTASPASGGAAVAGDAIHHAVPPVFAADWADGCYWLEGTPVDNRRWCAATGSVALVNLANVERTVELDTSFISGPNRPGELRISSALFDDETRPLAAAAERRTRTLAVPPGVHRVDFRAEAPPLVVPGDKRQLVFWVDQFRVQPVP